MSGPSPATPPGPPPAGGLPAPVADPSHEPGLSECGCRTCDPLRHEPAQPVTCRHCRRPIVACAGQPSHAGCSSGHGWIHAEPWWGHSCGRASDRHYAQPEPPAPPAATPPVTPLDTALEHVREARRYLGERNRYRQALEEIRDGDAEYAETCRTIARHALGGDRA